MPPTACLALATVEVIFTHVLNLITGKWHCMSGTIYDVIVYNCAMTRLSAAILHFFCKMATNHVRAKPGRGRSWLPPDGEAVQIGYYISVILMSVLGHQRASMSKNWRKIKISSFLFIIYMHNELQTCGKSWNVSGYYISVILICVFGHQGASMCLKIGKNLNISIPVYNLHGQWIANCGKSWNLSGYNISVILISLFGHRVAAACLKIGRNHNIVPVHNLHT